MALSAAQFEKALAAESAPPVWFVASSDPLMLLEAADAVRARARALGYGEREVFEVDARFDWDALEASFGMLSLFSARRLIEVRLPSGKPGKEGGALIEKFCADPVPDMLLLITAADWSGKHEAAWSRAVEKTGQAVVLWPPRPHELPAWIVRRLKSRGLEASTDAVAMLAERIEGNLLAAAQEIDKLALLAKGGRIDAREMAALVADSARYDVFRLTDTALAGEAAHALRMLAGLRGEGEQVVPLLSWLSSQVQLLAQFATVAEAGGNVAQAMTQARLWDAKQVVFKRALARGSASHFEALVADCARIDRISKGRAQGDPWIELERLVVGIAAPNALRAAPGRLGGRSGPGC